MEITQLTIIPIIMAITELFKRTTNISDRYTPIFAVILGVIISVFVKADFLMNTSLTVAILRGVVYGLTAVGIYSGAKNVKQEVKKVGE